MTRSPKFECVGELMKSLKMLQVCCEEMTELLMIMKWRAGLIGLVTESSAGGGDGCSLVGGEVGPIAGHPAHIWQGEHPVSSFRSPQPSCRMG